MVLQTSEEPRDGSPSVVLSSPHPVMAPFPGVGLLLKAAEIDESTDLMRVEARAVAGQTIREEENPFYLCCAATRQTTTFCLKCERFLL